MVVTFHVIGDAFVDLFSFLDGDWPEIGGDSLMSQPVQTYAGGSSVNTATHLESLVRNLEQCDKTDRVILHTILNPNDEYGRLLIAHAEKHGFRLVNCRSEDDPSWTGHCIAIVSGGERSFMTHQGCVRNFSANDLKLEQMINTDGPVHIHIAGYFNLTRFWHGALAEKLRHIRSERSKLFPNQPTTISLVAQHDASNVWDGGLDEVIQELDVLIMNELEASRIFRRLQGSSAIESEHDPLNQWIPVFSALNRDTCIVVTQGARGAVAFRDGALVARQTPKQVDVVDPTGAGDSFTAGFLHGVLSAGTAKDLSLTEESCFSANSIAQGLRWGCAMGAAGVTVRGASVPSRIKVIKENYEYTLQLKI